MLSQRVPLAALAATLFSLTACVDESGVGPDEPPPPSFSAANGFADGETLDTHWARLAANQIPGFAGHYLDSTGRSIVLLADMGRQADATTYIRDARTRMGLTAEGEVVFRQVQYGFDRLRAEHDRLYAAIGDHEGWVKLDVDEVENRLFLGALDETARAELRRIAETLNFPPDMLEIGISPPGAPRTDLDDRVRAVVGGVQVNRSAAYSECTLAFNVIHNDDPHFVTASHCSNQWYTSSGDGDAFRQPNAGNRIGVEVLDAAFWTGTKGGHTCYDPSGCRLSDSSLSIFDDSISDASAGRGKIARTQSPGYAGRGSMTIQGANPTWDIEEAQPAAYVPEGMWLNKVGRTSGWTRGQVTDTCWTLNLGGGDFLCVFTSNIWSEGGDSGSPIFLENNSQYTNSQSWVALAGILYGGPQGQWDETWHGTFSGIWADLGLGGTTKFCVPSSHLGC